MLEGYLKLMLNQLQLRIINTSNQQVASQEYIQR